MSWDPIHNFLDMVCSGGGKKARKRWKEAEKRDRDVRAKKHVITDPNISWGRHGAFNINPNADGSFNFEHAVEGRDDSINSFRVNIDPEQALALGATTRNSSGGWPQRTPFSPIPQMRPFGSGPRFGFRPEGSQEDGRTAPPAYMTEDPRFHPGFRTFQERARDLRPTDISRGSSSRRSFGNSGPNLWQPVSSGQAQESDFRSIHRENPRGSTRSHSTRRSESESRSRSQRTVEPSHIPISEVSNTGTVRVRTSQAPLGDMSRTYVEAMVPIADESSHRSGTSQSESRPRSRPRQTAEPSHFPVSQVSDTSTVRVRTSQAPLGDMSRTFVEGMVPIEEEERPRLPRRPRRL